MSNAVQKIITTFFLQSKTSIRLPIYLGKRISQQTENRKNKIEVEISEKVIKVCTKNPYTVEGMFYVNKKPCKSSQKIHDSMHFTVHYGQNYFRKRQFLN